MATEDATLLTARFEPPAPRPAAKDPPIALLALRMLESQIEGWPRAVFEKDEWDPGTPGAPLFVMAPGLVQQVLLDDAEIFSHGALFRRMMRPAWGKGLLVSKDAAWRVQRRAAAPAFRPAGMAAFAPRFAAIAHRYLARWRSTPQIDAAHEMQRLTFDVILDTMLSGADVMDRDATASRISGLLARIAAIRPSYLLAPDAWHDRRPSPATPERGPMIDDLRRMIAARRAAPPQGDLVDVLLTMRDPETNEAVDDDLLADNILGFVVAGHETTAVTLTWSLFLVASHKPSLDRLRAEVCAVAGDAPLGAEHVPGLVFTRQVLNEAMRLYPPAFLLTRVAERDTELGGRRVQKGRRINIPVYAMHRRAEVFPDPHAFDPDRFAPGAPEPDRFAYLPFGAGPRICLGAAFATVEAAVVHATLVRGADFTPPPVRDVWPVATLALNPRGGMPMGVNVRSLP